MATGTTLSSTAGTASPTVAPTVGASDDESSLSSTTVTIIIVVVVVVIVAAAGFAVCTHKKTKGFHRGTVSPHKHVDVKPAWDAPPTTKADHKSLA